MKKAKHFEGGGGADRVDQERYDSYDNSPEEAALKERGLKLSKGESSGLGRFFMGDIDKPGSEAYNKYGAGRAKAEDARVVAPVALPVRSIAVAPPVAEKPIRMGDEDLNPSSIGAGKKPIQMGDEDLSPSSIGAGRTPMATVKPPVKVKPVTPAITPARDVPRRPIGTGSGGGRGAAAGEVEQYQARNAPRRPMITGSGGGRGAAEGEVEKYQADQAAKRAAMVTKGVGRGQGPDTTASGIYGGANKEISDYYKSIQEASKKYRNNPKMFAKGGSVSSASSRGDGIAQRGKTRGRVL
jgi:hypothetical protein